MLVDGRSVELNTACVCALLAHNARGEGGQSGERETPERRRRELAVRENLPRKVVERILKAIDYVVFCVAQLMLMYV